MLVSPTLAIAADPIAFVALPANAWQVFITEIDGQNTRQLTCLESDARLPSWFPDRSKIAFTTSQGIAHIVDITSGKILDTVTIQGNYIWQASLGNDSKSLFLVAGDPNELDKTFITRFDLETRKYSHELRLSTPVYNLSISRSTGDLLFANSLCGSACNHVIQEIWLKCIADGSTRQLHMLDRMSANPCWTADGKNLLFDSENGSGRTLFKQAISSKEAEPFFPGSLRGNVSQPAVSRGGEFVAFVKDGALFYCRLAKPEKITRIVPLKDRPNLRVKDPAW